MSGERLPSKAFREAKASLERDGWSLVRRTGGGHFLFTHRSGARMIVPGTPRCLYPRQLSAEARRRVRATKAA